VLRETTSRGLCGLVCPSGGIWEDMCYEKGSTVCVFYCRT
jgi:hypothetical protein